MLCNSPAHATVVDTHVVGFLVCIERRDMGTEAFVPPDDFDFQYEATDGLYFKNPRTNILDEELGDIQSIITGVTCGPAT